MILNETSSIYYSYHFGSPYPSDWQAYYSYHFGSPYPSDRRCLSRIFYPWHCLSRVSYRLSTAFGVSYSESLPILPLSPPLSYSVRLNSRVLNPKLCHEPTTNLRRPPHKPPIPSSAPLPMRWCSCCYIVPFSTAARQLSGAPTTRRGSSCTHARHCKEFPNHFLDQ
jgi:hypothetical protein